MAQKNTHRFNTLVEQFSANVESVVWKIKKVLILGTQNFVRYTFNYYTRSHINFENDNITIETDT
ncbi:murein transglycosylase domain-containing protein [Candidatus Pantoea carbekii]|uniref:murein transglycosylase domain-containing protein n=1 Tax=Candidatus Pantoea carbekii TaxID=1235990 RepID=UPI00389963FA